MALIDNGPAKDASWIPELQPAPPKRLTLASIFDGVKDRKADALRQLDGERPSPVKAPDEDEKV